VVSDQLDRLEENPWIIGLASGNNFLMAGDGPNSAPVIDADVGSAADLGTEGLSDVFGLSRKDRSRLVRF
jgi:hypothetical protein